MSRPRYLKSFIVGALAVLWGVAIFCYLAFSRFEISEDAVTKITAMLENRPDKGPKIEEFEIPESYHQDVVDFLDGALPHRSQIDWAILGELKITTNSGDLVVLLFSAGNDLVFEARPGGKYKTGSLKDFIQTIGEARKTLAEE